MPSFLITSRVSASLPYVWSKFDQNLLAKLAPPFPIARIIQFDGCQVNDKVCIELDFLLYKTRWYSVISSYKADENAYVFVDEGTRVPFGIKAWRHEHRIELIDNQTSAIGE
jgi:ligand-binding SRPBCC domain-containing protein